LGDPRSNSCRDEVLIPFPERPVRPWGPLSVLLDEYRSTFSGVKRSGRLVNPLAQSNTKYQSYNCPYSICLYSVDRYNMSYCCTVRICRITSIINQQLHLHSFHIKHLKSLRHVSILSDHHQGALLFLAKVISHYSQFNSFLQTRCCGSMSLRCIRRTPSQVLSLQHIPTQHDMLPQHLVCKNELNRE